LPEETVKTTIDWVLLVIAFFYVVAFYFVWQNRGSEKVVTTAGLGLVGLIGALVAVIVFGAQPPLRKVFSSTYLIKLSNQQPHPLMGTSPRFTYGIYEIQQLTKVHPELFTNLENLPRSTLYHHLLQKNLVDWIAARYPGSWEIEIAPIGLMGEMTEPARPPDESQTRVTPAQLEEKLSGNFFSNMLGPLQNTSFSLPPHTMLQVFTPSMKDGLEVGEIELRNPFCMLRVTTRNVTWFRGAGIYKQVLHLSDGENSSLATSVYTVRTEVNFSRTLNGNPDMPRYVRWATSISEGLQDQFDEQVIWNKTRDSLLLQHTL
jgi:hypothetical protein